LKVENKKPRNLPELDTVFQAILKFFDLQIIAKLEIPFEILQAFLFFIHVIVRNRRFIIHGNARSIKELDMKNHNLMKLSYYYLLSSNNVTCAP